MGASRNNQASTTRDGVHASIAPKQIACKVVMMASPRKPNGAYDKKSLCWGSYFFHEGIQHPFAAFPPEFQPFKYFVGACARADRRLDTKRPGAPNQIARAACSPSM